MTEQTAQELEAFAERLQQIRTELFDCGADEEDRELHRAVGKAMGRILMASHVLTSAVDNAREMGEIE